MSAFSPMTMLDPARAAWQAKVRDFAATEVAPLVREMDANAALDPGLPGKLFDAGLMSIEIPQLYGGTGGDLFDVVLAIEQLAAVDPAVAVFVDVQNALVASALLRHGSGDQQRRFLPKLCAGTVGAYSVSEEQAGSDAFALSTTATPDGDGFVLRGSKRWTTSGAEAGLFLVFAKVTESGRDDRLTAFLVERDLPGVAVGPPMDKLGIRASSTCDLILDGVRLGPESVLGGVGGGELLAVETLNVGKIGIAAQLVGLADGALSAAVSYARERHQFGEPIGNYQGVRFPLAALAAEIAAARALLYDSAATVAHGDTEQRLSAAAMAKYIAANVAERAASHAVEVFGGNGFTTGFPAEKFYRDVKIGAIYEGTSNMQFRTIGALLFGTGS